MESVTVMMRQMLRYMFSIFMFNSKIRIFPNQEECARKVVASICRDDKPITLVTAEPQAGKTGTMFASMNLIVQSVDMLPNISIDNFFVITGLSDRSWIEQTCQRFPEEMKGNILHRNQLKELKNLIGDKQNVFIFVDEIHVAVQVKQTIDKVFKECGFQNPDILKEKGIKLILFSATPNAASLDLKKWEDHVDEIHLEPGEGYTSNLDMLRSGHAKQFGFFANDAYATEVFKTIKFAEEQAGHPLYHVVRLPKDGAKNEEDVITPSKFAKYFKEEAITIKLTASRGNIQDLNELLEGDIPSKTTVVYIVDSYRCAKTLPKTLLGVWVERKAQNMRDDIAVQGNRLVGYDTKIYNYIFTNLKSIDNYYELMRNGFVKGPWNSNTTRGVGENLVPRRHTAYQRNVDGEDSTRNADTDYQLVTDKWFRTLTEANQFVKELHQISCARDPEYKGRKRFNVKKPNEQGFIEDLTGYNGNAKQVYSVEDRVAIPSANWSGRQDCMLGVCYEDVTNPETVRFYVFYRKYNVANPVQEVTTESVAVATV